MTKHMSSVNVSYEWSPIQRNSKHQNLRHKTVIHTHPRAMQYAHNPMEKFDERSGESSCSHSSVRSGQDVVLSLKIVWHKYFGRLLSFRKSTDRASKRQRKALSQVFASLNEEHDSDSSSCYSN